MDSVRLDRWLCAARIFKSRTQAGQACAAGRVTVNQSRAKPHHPVRVGDEVRARAGDLLRVFEVLALAESRLSPPRARELYVDHSPPPPPREEVFLPRERGAGRPTKRDRRRLRKLWGLD
jgi:ribosome-associated heat shock protein Hsp15